MKESNKQAFEIAQQSMNQMAEQMTVMCNILQHTGKDNADPNNDNRHRRQRDFVVNRIRKSRKTNPVIFANSDI